MCPLRRAAPLLTLHTLHLALGVSASARADDAVTAREHYQKGTSYYDLGKYDDAIKEFEAAYEIKNDPALLYNLAQSNRLAGNSEQALHFYRTYLRYVPKATNRAEIESRIAQLDQLVSQKNAAQVTPPNQAIPPGATTPPATPEPPPGAPPAVPPETPVAATPPPEGAAPMPPSPGVEPPSTVAGTPGLVATPAPTVSDRVDRARRLKKYGVITAAIGGGLFLVGALFGNAAVGAANDIDDTAKKGGTYDPSVETRGKNDQAAEAGFMVVGVLAAAAGGALYLYGRNQEQVAVTPVASASGLGANLTVRF
jgi:tetratricopeptide (TPR) repeat protein